MSDVLTLCSTAFESGSPIPERFTCRGADHSPPLAWSGAPVGTQSFALIVDDPDAPDPAAPRRVWVHWVVWNIPSDMTELGEGASPDRLPRGAREGRHDGGGIGYSGPCPPVGDHRYFHKLYALDTRLATLDTGATKAELERAISGHVLATAELVGMCAARAPDGEVSDPAR